MKIWKLKCVSDQYAGLLGTIDDVKRRQSFNGRPLAAEWTPVVAKKQEEDSQKELGDAPFENRIGLPVFSKRAVDTLYHLIAPYVEFLPLVCDAGAFYAVNVLPVLDAVDYAKAQYKMFPGTKRIMHFGAYAFRPEVVGKYPIFRLADEPLKKPFISDEMKETIDKARLKGMGTELVWDSDLTQ